MSNDKRQTTNDQCSQAHRSGFVNIVGNPNVGKSTLMNALVGERLSIITSKAQTTRHRILGIVNGDDFQMVYSDTPGVLSPNYRLQEQMLEFSRSALVDADVLLYVTEPQDSIDRNADFVDKVKRMAAAGTKVFLIINKIDLTTQDTLERLVDFWHAQLPEATIFPISAQERFGVAQLFDAIREALPVGPPFFPKDQLTDKPARFFVNEIIREKILLNYDKEIPYSVEVEVESFKEVERKKSFSPKDGLSAERSFSDNGLSGEAGPSLYISAVIYCERDSQKGIIIGRAGSALKRVGSMARKDIEEFFQRPVFLELFVKVDRDWRSNQNRLRHYGYDLS
ncbi:MAG: GTPase Era [Paludibacteraceae bacterium]|nr:GTPase Era [Paludibacteraceae bacterium]